MSCATISISFDSACFGHMENLRNTCPDGQAKQKTFSGPGGGGDCLNCFIVLISNQKFLCSFSFQCFMNSILQCLSHTRLLTRQLLKGSHTKKINSSSGMKGKLIHGM